VTEGGSYGAMRVLLTAWGSRGDMEPLAALALRRGPGLRVRWGWTIAGLLVGALPVLRGGELAGIISERDYARKVILLGRSSAETPVWQIMSAPAITVAPEETVQHCMEIMTERRIRHLPVIDDSGRMVGMISIGDCVRAVIEDQKDTIQQLERFISG